MRDCLGFKICWAITVYEISLNIDLFQLILITAIHHYLHLS